MVTSVFSSVPKPFIARCSTCASKSSLSDSSDMSRSRTGPSVFSETSDLRSPYPYSPYFCAISSLMNVSRRIPFGLQMRGTLIRMVSMIFDSSPLSSALDRSYNNSWVASANWGWAEGCALPAFDRRDDMSRATSERVTSVR